MRALFLKGFTMNYLKLTSRLECIANLVPRGSFTADIGTDHALLPIYLIKSGITNRCIASDIVDGPLESARKNIAAAGLCENIEVVKSDGLDNVYPFTPETVIIAGMGGETITEIISNCDYSKSGTPLFLLQPMTHTETLREYLLGSGFSILGEQVIQEDRRFYVVISAQFGESPVNHFDGADLDVVYELGGIMPYCPAHINYLLWRKQTAESALSGILKSSTNSKKADLLKKVIDEVDRRLNYGKDK